jgi:hypothetical protein
MSNATACWLIAAVLFPGGVLLALGLCRTAGRASRAEEAREETVHDVGPDSLLLLETLDAHLDAHAAQLAGLYERLGPPDLAWDAGCERLLDVIRDERQKGDQA